MIYGYCNYPDIQKPGLSRPQKQIQTIQTSDSDASVKQPINTTRNWFELCIQDATLAQMVVMVIQSNLLIKYFLIMVFCCPPGVSWGQILFMKSDYLVI